MTVEEMHAVTDITLSVCIFFIPLLCRTTAHCVES